MLFEQFAIQYLVILYFFYDYYFLLTAVFAANETYGFSIRANMSHVIFTYKRTNDIYQLIRYHAIFTIYGQTSKTN